jgi:hypothetical protein
MRYVARYIPHPEETLVQTRISSFLKPSLTESMHAIYQHWNESTSTKFTEKKDVTSSSQNH